MGLWVLDTGGQFKGMFRAFSDTNACLASIAPRNCSVSTITLCGRLDGEVKIADVLEYLRSNDVEGLDLPPDSPKTRAKTFFNQITVKAGTTSIKLFSNGAIHVTGAKSLIHFIDVMGLVCRALAVTTPDDPAPILETASISMINAIFSASRTLPLRVLRQALEDAGHSASYDPDAYPGINAKINTSESNGTITVMIFTTGNVIISGAKTPAHIAQAYDTVCRVIDSLGLQTNASPVSNCSAGVLDMYTIVQGYSSRLAHLCYT